MRLTRLLRGADRALKNTSDSTIDRAARSVRDKVPQQHTGKIDKVERWVKERKRAQ